ncbi:UNVERIFIED_CONTAM: germination protein M [Acetivibrio alkalicellulosi]
MKKFICSFILVCMVFFYGCDIPVDNVSEGDSTSEQIGTEDKNLDTYTFNEFEEDEIKEVEEAEEIEIKNDSVTKEVMTITAYYRDSDDLIIPFTRQIERQEGIARAVIESMIYDKSNIDKLNNFRLKTVLPENTCVLGMNIKDGTVIVDFNENFLDYSDKKEEINIVSGVVYALTEFKTIDKVKILINGEEQGTLKYGSDISGFLSRDNVLINSEKLNVDDRTKKLDVYLFKNINEKFDYLVPVSYEYIGVEDEKLPCEIVRLLTKSYEKQNLFSQLPENAELLDSKLEKDVLVINFNEELKNYGGSAREHGILNQIIHSMKQIKGATSIKILVEGKEGELPEGTDISREIPIPEIINSDYDRG